MAENKLSWTELRRALANRAGVSEKEANLFLQAFNAQLIEALKQDKQVKINGLGIFRLQAVAPRKSVNVSSGEEITIEGYNKIAFMPEAGVKELVEKGTVAKQEQTAPAVRECTRYKGRSTGKPGKPGKSGKSGKSGKPGKSGETGKSGGAGETRKPGKPGKPGRTGDAYFPREHSRKAEISFHAGHADLRRGAADAAAGRLFLPSP